MLDPIIRNTRKNCNGLLAQLLDQGQKNVIVKTKKKKRQTDISRFTVYFGAGYGTRTRRLLLGKQPLYRMS